MAIRIDRVKGRFVCEFQQGGTRILRRLPAGITQAQAKEYETKLRRELFDRDKLGKKPDLTLTDAIGRWLLDNDRWIEQNLSGRITLLKERNKREVYLAKSQVAALAKASTYPAAIWLASYTGLRASELLALSKMPTNSDALTVKTSKSGKPRLVPIAGPARRWLSALPLECSYWQWHKDFLRARKAIGMPHLRIHDLRHTCASWLINAGVDLYTVGKILGHSGPATTARYAHLADATLKKAMARLK